MMALKSLASKQRLLTIGKQQVKSKRCLVMDPNKADIGMKLLWVVTIFPTTVIVLLSIPTVTEVSKAA